MKDLMVSLKKHFPKGEAEAISRILMEDFAEGVERDKALARVLLGEPVQYVSGKTIFSGTTIQVNRNVLIPRPETEELVEMVLREHPPEPSLRVMDIGTGSGCIPVAIASKRSKWNVFGVDVSPQALKLALRNADCNGVEVEFWLQDILSAETGMLPSQMDILISNPPYITTGEAPFLEPVVRDYEPHLALFVPGNDPLVFYKAIAGHALRLLKRGGKIWFECNPLFIRDIQDHLKNAGFRDPRVLQDLSGKERFVHAFLK